MIVNSVGHAKWLRRDHLTRSKCLDDLAVGDCPVTAGSDHPVEFAAQRAQIGDLAIDFGEVDARDPVDRFAGLVLVIRQREELAHGIEREAEIAGAADERRTRQMIMS